ncbi:hypothetical protein EVAR_36663_1 [Eumeta japonica]|uniref:Uncharacterized protein n=1 Tax=Eumeta variegata TaxID=151549 RepID=A0A4C1XZB8_EUMVA|nr:hypothetical protein EVAR_36663_1 [Eumeta japonica]
MGKRLTITTNYIAKPSVTRLGGVTSRGSDPTSAQSTCCYSRAIFYPSHEILPLASHWDFISIFGVYKSLTRFRLPGSAPRGARRGDSFGYDLLRVREAGI